MVDLVQELQHQLKVVDNKSPNNIGQRINLLLALAKELRLMDPARGLTYAQRAYSLSSTRPITSDDYALDLMNSLLQLGILEYLQSQYQSALLHLFEAQVLAESHGHIQVEAEAWLTIGRIYTILGDLSLALDYSLTALKKCKAANYTVGEAEVHNTIGIIYSQLDNHTKELQEFYKALAIHQATGHQSGEATLLNDIAMTHMALGNYEDALATASQSLQLAHVMKLDMLEANLWCTIGEIWLAKEDFQQALTFIEKSIEMAHQLSFPYLEMYALMTLGYGHLQDDNPVRALSLLEQAINLAQKLGTKTELARCHQLLAEAYKRLHKFEVAIYHHEQFHAAHTEVFNEESDKKIRNLQIVHDTATAQQEAEIYRLKNVELENEIRERKLMEQQRLEIAMEREKSRILTQFIDDALHEFRTPLSIIDINLYLLSTAITDSKQQKYIHNINNQTENILTLVQGLVNMAKMDSDTALEMGTVGVNQLIESILTSRQTVLDKNKVQTKLALMSPLPQLQGDAEKLALAIGSIIDNAIQYTPVNGTVTIRTDLKDNLMIIEVEDTGVGIDQQDLPHIFERFWRKDEAHTTPGFGLGLPIAQQITERHKGRIEVESIPGQGSLFRIMLPLA